MLDLLCMFVVFFKQFIKELRRKVTIVFIHHGKIKPLKFNFSFLFILVLFLSWTSFTLWAGFVSGKYVDYLVMKADCKITKLRMFFLSDQIKKLKENLSQIKQNDDNIRCLLAMNTRKIIIENYLVAGGSTPVEASTLAMLLSGKTNNINHNNMAKQSFDLLEECKVSINSYSEIVKYIDRQREIFRYTPSIWPCNGIITSSYGIRFHPFFGNKIFHPAIDIANDKNTPIVSTADGVVIFSGWLSGYGNVIAIEHGHKYKTIYAHLSNFLVKKGEIVVKGQEIAKMGMTGRATGPHLHYELHLNKKPINPMKYLNSYLD